MVDIEIPFQLMDFIDDFILVFKQIVSGNCAECGTDDKGECVVVLHIFLLGCVFFL